MCIVNHHDSVLKLLYNAVRYITEDTCLALLRADHPCASVRLHVLSYHLPGLNSCDEQGNTPLHWAVERNKVESCRALLDFGADSNILNMGLLSPLHLAVSLEHNNLVEVRKLKAPR